MSEKSSLRYSTVEVVSVAIAGAVLGMVNNLLGCSGGR